MKRRHFLRLLGGSGSAAWLSRAVRPADRSATEQGEDPVAEAEERIQRHRRGPGVVLVRDAAGQPVPGAQVRVEQVRHAFRFGCNLFRFGRLPEPEIETAYRDRFSALLNYATLGFYWPMYEPQSGRPTYDYTDRVVDWCAAHQIVCKGHPLVWDFADPRWLPQEFADIRRLSHKRVEDIVTRFKGRIDLWDVVNEPTHLGRFKTRLGEWALSEGAVPYTRDHLKIARHADPDAVLLVNDYRTDPAFYQILDQLREGGKLLFDAVGIQSHMHDGGWPLRRVWEVCDRYAALGLPIHFTETTIVSGPRRGPGENWGPTSPELEARQADYVPKFYTMLFAHPSVEAITWWDFSDNGAWQRAAAGWLRADMSPKPVYDRLLSLIKGRWWTRAEGDTNAQGEYRLEAFYGVQRVAARLPDGRATAATVPWAPGQSNRVELRLPPA